MLAVRPENVALGGRRRERLRGRIAFASYLGNTLRYDVRDAGGLVLKADIRDPWHHDRLPLGEAVTLCFPASVALALTRGLSASGRRVRRRAGGRAARPASASG